MDLKQEVLELHQTIKALERRTTKARNLAAALLDEIEEMDGMLEVLKHDYKTLKEKAGFVNEQK